MDQMLWPLNGPETIGTLIGLSGIVWPSVWNRHEAAAKAVADQAVQAQAEAMANKDQEIAAWKDRYERDTSEWHQRYDQEHRERREDAARYQDRIDRLEASRSSRKDRT